MKHIDPKTLHGWISDGQELAIIDAREDGEFGTDHLFWAVPFGMAHRETRAHTLLPRKSVRICVTDDGGRLATDLAAWLEANGGNLLSQPNPNAASQIQPDSQAVIRNCFTH